MDLSSEMCVGDCYKRLFAAMLSGLLRHYSAPSRRLEECLTKELKLEKKSMVEVPIVSGFEVSYIGSLATLTHKHNGETLVPRPLPYCDHYSTCHFSSG